MPADGEAPITRAHWVLVDPAMGAHTAAYDELRAQWKARRPLRGWKIGVHHAMGRALLGVETSFLGYLPVATEHPENAPIDLTGDQYPGVEAEIAVHMCRSVVAGCGDAELNDAIAGLSIAAELVDIRGTHANADNVLRRNMFHRGFVLPAGAVRPIAEYDDAVVRIHRNGRERAAVSPATVLGDIRWAVAFVADSLSRVGEQLGAGEIILTGAVTPLPIWARPGDVMVIDAGSLGRLNLRFGPV